MSVFYVIAGLAVAALHIIVIRIIKQESLGSRDRLSYLIKTFVKAFFIAFALHSWRLFLFTRGYGFNNIVGIFMSLAFAVGIWHLAVFAIGLGENAIVVTRRKSLEAEEEKQRNALMNRVKSCNDEDLFDLGMAIINGTNGFSRNYQEGMAYLAQAAEKGSTKAAREIKRLDDLKEKESVERAMRVKIEAERRAKELPMIISSILTSLEVLEAQQSDIYAQIAYLYSESEVAHLFSSIESHCDFYFASGINQKIKKAGSDLDDKTKRRAKAIEGVAFGLRSRINFGSIDRRAVIGAFASDETAKNMLKRFYEIEYAKYGSDITPNYLQ